MFLDHITLQGSFISALIISHGRSIVRRAIESVLNQSLDRSSYELIVVADRDIDLLEQYAEYPMVKIIRSQRRDPGGKWAEAISVAKGEIVCFLDDDDEWIDKKLEYIQNKFDSDPHLGYYHNGQV